MISRRRKRSMCFWVEIARDTPLLNHTVISSRPRPPLIFRAVEVTVGRNKEKSRNIHPLVTSYCVRLRLPYMAANRRRWERSSIYQEGALIDIAFVKA